MRSSRLRLTALSLGLIGSVPALAAPRTSPPSAEAADVSAFKAKLKLLTDGRGHYIAIVPFGGVDQGFFYGDGKALHQQRVSSGGSSGTESFDRLFWEPRVKARSDASFEFRDNRYTLTCGERKTEFKPVADAEQATMLGAARYYKPRWERRAHALARNDRGEYYYVDRQREPEDSKDFRLFAGSKGAMKQQRLTQVDSDSGGDVFTTKKGALSLVPSKSEAAWVVGKTKTELMLLPVEDNTQLIYSELGVYKGEGLGTPCDDL